MRDEKCGFTTCGLLGKGSFGEVWAGWHPKTDEVVAIKFTVATPDSPTVSLFHEAKVLAELGKDQTQQGVPQLHYVGTASYQNFMVMERLGESLEAHFRRMNKTSQQSCGFSVQTVILIAQQTLHRLEYLHSKCFIHRDIKPSNFLLGIGKRAHHIYLCDFGLTTPYWIANNKGSGKHIPWATGGSLGGTARYASIHNHKGCKQGRRDDLQSLGYMLLEMTTGSLPWGSGRDPNGCAGIARKKQEMPLCELMAGAPLVLGKYMSASLALSFKERPDYDHLQTMFRSCRLPATKDYDFDWLKDSLDFQPSELEPLQPRVPLTQPDDNARPCQTSRLWGLMKDAQKTAYNRFDRLFFPTAIASV